ncbi:hypothetical protein [Halorubrum sp. Boch-26]|uniref:hypothetical protein n=1 Tax=Halorubrum sp. Boch-26 TaxID=2994426 RepID=UPI002469BC9C|nr:hypothetical protein [Halorubrum sp. Boch-26]
MGLDAEVEKIKARGASGTSLTDGPEDISEGVEATLSTGTGAASSATLFIEVQGAIELTIEFSPDGSTWYEPAAESPIGFDTAGEDVAFIDYDASHLRVTGSNNAAVNLDLRVTA